MENGSSLDLNGRVNLAARCYRGRQVTISVIDGWGTLENSSLCPIFSLIGIRLVQRLFLEFFGTITL